ncbi:ATP-binding cassette domain-containing protein [Paenibacillus albiflavus]|uniref:ATP-binding cassette domain-containing protein n=1 Tax=Paenibacillus albiflavus TaxID=2545760 RepID=A0A4R4EP10_9BACL|nr:ATP-binding cassette domain-containing protein [Paenibacillus albiflavus]TCZ80108.1 ATP-binding cassette domain-containing protein [Paenibacillus albiflavus]
MIIVKGLKKKYGNNQILSGVDFAAYAGDFIVLLGTSGSGKSTVFRCMTLRESWDEGELIYNGANVDKSSWKEKLKLRKEWAYLEEKPNLNKNRTALKNVISGRFLMTSIWKLLGVEEKFDALDMLDKVGLQNKAHLVLDKLSGGEKQRVAIAKALVQGAKVLVMDEPITGLEPESATRVLDDLKNLCETQNITVICTLNQINLAEKYANRILGLSDGKIVVNVSGRRLTQREKDLIN